MVEYRTHMKIIGDILTTTRDELADDNGATVTFLIRKANISHVRISRILTNLVSQGLLEHSSVARMSVPSGSQKSTMKMGVVEGGKNDC